MMKLQDLPYDVFEIILENLSVYDVCRLSATCKSIQHKIRYSPSHAREFCIIGEYDVLLRLGLLERFGTNRVFPKDSVYEQDLLRCFATISDPGFWHSQMLIALIHDVRIPVANNDDWLFRIACLKGDLKVVKGLLSLSREENDSLPGRKIDPFARTNQGLASACENGHVELVAYLRDQLLTKWKENPHLLHVPFVRSCYKGHLSVAELFFDKEKYFSLVSVAAKVEALKLAAIADHIDIVKLIIGSREGELLIQSIPRGKSGPKVQNFLAGKLKVYPSFPIFNSIGVLVIIILAYLVKRFFDG